jgi:hypothetical protein
MTQNPAENTAIGARLTIESELIQLISKREGDEKRVLDFGQGFLSIRECDNETTPPTCNISTPGTVIANQLNKALGVGQDVLVEADEIDELITALLSQLLNRVFSAGLSNSNNDIVFPDSPATFDPINWRDVIDYVAPEFDDDGGGDDPTDPSEPPSVDDPVGPPNPPPADPVGGPTDPSDPTDPADPVDPPADPADPADPVT